MSVSEALSKAEVEAQISECTDCAEHPAGCCWTHKVRYMRAGQVGVTVPNSFKSEFTNRERIAEAHNDAARTGRPISPYKG